MTLLVCRCAFCGPEDEATAPGVCIAKATDADAVCSRLDPGTWNASTVSSTPTPTAAAFANSAGNGTDVQASFCLQRDCKPALAATGRLAPNPASRSSLKVFLLVPNLVMCLGFTQTGRRMHAGKGPDSGDAHSTARGGFERGAVRERLPQPVHGAHHRGPAAVPGGLRAGHGPRALGRQRGDLPSTGTQASTEPLLFALLDQSLDATAAPAAVGSELPCAMRPGRHITQVAHRTCCCNSCEGVIPSTLARQHAWSVSFPCLIRYPVFLS